MALSVEVQSIIAYVANTGVQHRVTATLGKYISAANPCSPHSATSNHCRAGTSGQGLAVDLAEPTPSSNTPGLLAIFNTFKPVESKLSELYYSGAPYGIRAGKHITIEPEIRNTHWNHVHVAVPKGTLLMPLQAPDPGNEVITMPDPIDPGVTGPPNYDLSGVPCAISAVFDSSGNVKGYYIMTDDGSVAAIGNIPYLGRVH